MCGFWGDRNGNPGGLSMAHKLSTAILLTLLYGTTQASQSTHKISFTFDYDFRATPACSPKVKQACVQQFNFYDISAGILKRTKLGSLPVPAGATGLVTGITFTTESFLFNPGRHMVAVSAQMPNGTESDLSKCSTIVRIP
jgi:hypothetical protein